MTKILFFFPITEKRTMKGNNVLHYFHMHITFLLALILPAIWRMFLPDGYVGLTKINAV